jgi:hypothetical protein
MQIYKPKGNAIRNVGGIGKPSPPEKAVTLRKTPKKVVHNHDQAQDDRDTPLKKPSKKTSKKQLKKTPKTSVDTDDDDLDDGDGNLDDNSSCNNPEVIKL